MPETQFTITQGTLTVTEMGNSVPYSGKLDALSAQPVKEIIHQVLKHDAKKALDVEAHAQFKLTALRYVATTSTEAGTLYTNGTATGSNAIALGKGHVKDIVDEMKERNIPPYMADDYFALGHPSAFRTLKNDLEAIHQYTDKGLGMIFNGEIGRYEGVRFIEQTNITKANMTQTGAFAAATSSGVYFFGADTVAEAIVVPEEMRGKIPTDFGRSKGIAWYYLGGYGLIHTAAAQTRIVAWDSAT